MTLYMVLITGAAIIGAFYLAKGKALEANIIFAITNPLLAWENFQAGELEQGILFLVFTGLAIYGIINLGSQQAAQKIPGPEDPADRPKVNILSELI